MLTHFYENAQTVQTVGTLPYLLMIGYSRPNLISLTASVAFPKTSPKIIVDLKKSPKTSSMPQVPKSHRQLVSLKGNKQALRAMTSRTPVPKPCQIPTKQATAKPISSKAGTKAKPSQTP